MINRKNTKSIQAAFPAPFTSPQVLALKKMKDVLPYDNTKPLSLNPEREGEEKHHPKEPAVSYDQEADILLEIGDLNSGLLGEGMSSWVMLSRELLGYPNRPSQGEHYAVKIPKETIAEKLAQFLEDTTKEILIYKSLGYNNCFIGYMKNTKASPDKIAHPPFFVFPYIKGVPLDKFLPNDPSSVHLIERLDIAISAIQALQNLHQVKYSHGDFTKKNILYDAEKNCSYLIDFALAEKIASPRSGQSIQQDIMHALNFMYDLGVISENEQDELLTLLKQPSPNLEKKYGSFQLDQLLKLLIQKRNTLTLTQKEKERLKENLQKEILRLRSLLQNEKSCFSKKSLELRDRIKELQLIKSNPPIDKSELLTLLKKYVENINHRSLIKKCTSSFFKQPINSAENIKKIIDELETHQEPEEKEEPVYSSPRQRA